MTTETAAPAYDPQKHGHVQFNGTNFVYYEAFQPSLNCELPDHSTCAARWAEIEGARSEEEKAAKDQERQARAAEVEEAAKKAARNLHQKRVDEAGRRKHEAHRQAGTKKEVAIRAANDKAAKIIQTAMEAYQEASRKAQADFASEQDAATAKHIEESRAIEGKDWLDEVEAEAEGKTNSGSAG